MSEMLDRLITAIDAEVERQNDTRAPCDKFWPDTPELVQAVIAALDAAGYAIVPRKLTAAMSQDAWGALGYPYDGWYGFEEAWEAALAAAAPLGEPTRSPA